MGGGLCEFFLEGGWVCNEFHCNSIEYSFISTNTFFVFLLGDNLGGFFLNFLLYLDLL